MQKIINAVFTDKNKDQVYTEKVYQYDYGRVLRIQGLDLPAAVKSEIKWLPKLDLDNLMQIMQIDWKKRYFMGNKLN